MRAELERYEMHVAPVPIALPGARRHFTFHISNLTVPLARLWGTR